MLHNLLKIKTVVLYLILISSTLMVVLPVLSFSKTGHLLHVNVAKELRKRGSSIFSQTASNSTKENRLK